MRWEVNSTIGLGISSGHIGGVNVLFADGHIEFLDDDSSAETLRALITLSGGEDLPEGF